MGLRLFYRPISGRDYLQGNGQFQNILEEVFGDYPITLTLEHREKLGVISSCGWTQVDEIIEALDKYGSIIVGRE